jgi:hypothetical protein
MDLSAIPRSVDHTTEDTALLCYGGCSSLQLWTCLASQFMPGESQYNVCDVTAHFPTCTPIPQNHAHVFFL